MSDNDNNQQFLQPLMEAGDRPAKPWVAPTVMVIEMKMTLAGQGSDYDYGGHTATSSYLNP